MKCLGVFPLLAASVVALASASPEPYGSFGPPRRSSSSSSSISSISSSSSSSSRIFGLPSYIRNRGREGSRVRTPVLPRR